MCSTGNFHGWLPLVVYRCAMIASFLATMSAAVAQTRQAAEELPTVVREDRRSDDRTSASVRHSVKVLAPGRVRLAGLAGVAGFQNDDRITPVPQVRTSPPDHNTQQAVQTSAVFQRQATGAPTRSQVPKTSTKYVLRQTSAAEELNLRVGLPQILTFHQPPVRTYVPESGKDIVAIRYIDPDAPRRVAIEPLATGTTMLTMWFRDETSPDGEEPVSWLVHVTEAEAGNVAFHTQLEALEDEVNYAFPNSSVQLSWVGSQVLLRGKAKDVEEATQIARVVSSSVPGDSSGQGDGFVQQAKILPIDVDGIREAGSIPGALRGDTNTGVNQSRINNNVINMLEISGIHQVMLKVTIAEVNRSASRAIGADLQVGSVGDAVRFFTTLGPVAGAGSLVLEQNDFNLAISALKQLNLARSLAEPTLTTLNGQPANFNVGGSFPIPVVTGQTATGLQGVDFQNFGVQLQFVPIVTDGDRIRLTLQASVSTRDEAASAQVGNTNIPGLNTRDFSNTVELREGQTLAVAGLIQSNLGGTSSRVPFAGDVPILGRLFSNDGTSYDEQELVILVTPYLAGPVDAERAEQLALPGSDYFEPDDLEFFLKGRLTGHLAEDYRSPIRTDLQKMKAFRRCEQELIIGQPGHSSGLMCPPAHTAVGTETHRTLAPPALPTLPAPVPQSLPHPVAPPDSSIPIPDTAGRISLNETAQNGGVR